MRFFLIVTACALVACGGAKPSQASKPGAGKQAATTASPTGKSKMFAGPVSGAKAVAIMHERHEGMEAIGNANKTLRRELGGSTPDLTVVKAAATKIAGLGGRASGWFPAGTGPEVGKTGAKPEIWRNERDFAARLAAFQHASQAFNAAAQSGKLDAIHARYADLGGTCKACHDSYRTDMHH